MTYLGTRPPTVDEWDKYELHHRARLATKPGLTGMWQVSGRSNITDFANLILKGLSLISGPIFTRIMPTDQYGIVSTFQSWQSLLAVIVTLNLSQGVFNNGMLEFKENRDMEYLYLLKIFYRWYKVIKSMHLSENRVM